MSGGLPWATCVATGPWTGTAESGFVESRVLVTVCEERCKEERERERRRVPGGQKIAVQQRHQSRSARESDAPPARHTALAE